MVGVEERRRRGGSKIRVGVEREQVGRCEASLKKVSLDLVCLAGLVSLPLSHSLSFRSSPSSPAWSPLKKNLTSSSQGKELLFIYLFDPVLSLSLWVIPARSFGGRFVKRTRVSSPEKGSKFDPAGFFFFFLFFFSIH